VTVREQRMSVGEPCLLTREAFACLRSARQGALLACQADAFYGPVQAPRPRRADGADPLRPGDRP
jgi:hypothetical protein